MKKIIICFVIIAVAGVAVAQDYKKIFYKTQSIENADVKVVISDAVATSSGIKFRVQVYNKTNDYIIYKPSESAFKIKGKESKPIEEWLVIRPNEDDYRTVDLKGPQHMVAADYQFILNGLYRIPLNSKSTNVPDFKLPPAQNEFNAGGFNIILEKFKKETGKTDARFKVRYLGDNIGILELNKVGMKMPDGKEYANYNADKKILIFAKNDEKDFTVAWKDIPKASGDMQFVDMNILWRDAFKDAVPEKLSSLILTILFDEETTKDKGK